ncbi:MAG: carbohydrate-binding protein SusD [Bacteroidetes bacterium RBG_13_43_22]|nr:MAG: carbohydrate-binding protein SusD [Bacteroidetes bacterium RBG_13_43_22]OFY73800.1 MAG: carbohydrate-binding protein SusD [Bacteroidetes bacterium RBG_19FT_COMBO_42_7]
MKKYTIQGKKLLMVPVLIVALLISSCEDIIDLNPYSSIDENSAFSTPSLVNLSVMGMYQAAQRGDYAGNLRGYPWGAAFVQQGDNRGEDVVNIFTFYQLTYTNTYDPTTANNVWWWSDSYRLINRTNIVLKGVQTAADNNVITQAVADQYKGEALLLRAITHFELLIHFARPYKHTADASHPGVPYRETAYTNQVALDDGVKQGRNTVAECYQKVLADLDLAEQYLPARAERGAGKPGLVRSTKQAAAAFKTRVYLHMYDWANVITEGSKFLTGGVYAGSYSLPADPGTTFLDSYTNSESIFSIENAGTNNPGVNAALASQYKRRILVCISPIIWRDAAWLTDDERRSTTSETTTPTIHMVYNSAGRMYTNKYKDVTNYSDASPLIRYAEVLLNLAEAYCRNATPTGAPDANALTYFNMVRNRSLANPASQGYTAASFADNVALLGAILKERRIEFLMEGRRWPDIHRLQFCPYYPINGIPAKLANGLPASSTFTLGTPYTGALGVTTIPYDDYRFLWPIPRVETDANPTLADQQNPGW